MVPDVDDFITALLEMHEAARVIDFPDMGAPFGDFHCSGYEVDCSTQQITLRASQGTRRTDLIFSGVVGYEFVGDNFATILGHVVQTPLADFIANNLARFAQTFASFGAPSFWSTDGSAVRIANDLAARDLRAYELTSSYGMCGWVVARGFSTHLKEVLKARDE